MFNNFRIRLYLETTVFNYFFDVERPGHEDVVRLFEVIKAGEIRAYTSRYFTDELERAQEPKKSKMLSLIDEYGIITLDFKEEAVRLAKEYIDEDIIPKSHLYDSIHVAISSLHELDIIVSYNFYHINRAKTQRKTSAINSAKGYKSVNICTAEEVLEIWSKD